jgi:hypothetical protein
MCHKCASTVIDCCIKLKPFRAFRSDVRSLSLFLPIPFSILQPRCLSCGQDLFDLAAHLPLLTLRCASWQHWQSQLPLLLLRPCQDAFYHYTSPPYHHLEGFKWLWQLYEKAVPCLCGPRPSDIARFELYFNLNGFFC